MAEQEKYMERSVDFHLKEFDSLRQEIVSSVEEGRRLERYALVITSGVWVWLLTHPDIQLPLISWWIPFLFTCIGGIHAYTQLKNIQLMAEYIQILETMFCRTGELKGWQTFLLEKRQTDPGELRFRRSAAVYWVILFLATAFAPLLFGVL